MPMTDSAAVSREASCKAGLALRTLAREFIEEVIRALPHENTARLHAAVREKYDNITKEDFDNAMQKCNELKGHFVTEAQERGYWSFYHEELAAAADTDPTGYNRRNIHFFFNTFKLWKLKSPKSRRQYYKLADKRTKDHPAWQMPASLTAKLSHGLGSVVAGSQEALSHQGELEPSDQSKHDELSLSELQGQYALEYASLKSLTARFQAIPDGDSDAKYWLREISNLSQDNKQQNLEVAIVGDTGAGKSSLINALLGEDLVPCSSQGACTSFAIGISHRASSEREPRILVTVHFIDQESFAAEFEGFFSTLIRNVDASKESLANEDGCFEQLLEKFHLLCPTLLDKEISDMQFQDLLEQRSVKTHLGQTKQMFFDRAEEACAFIGDLIADCRAFDRVSEGNYNPCLAPLVRYVQVEVNNEILKDGLVLTDLPGIHDSNKARGAVAEQHLSRCSAAWIIAHAIRASDNAGASQLIDRSLKQGFYLDGVSLTFICTKTDDIGPPEEEAKKLKVGGRVSVLKEKQNESYQIICESTAALKRLEGEQRLADLEIARIKHGKDRYYSILSKLEEGLPQQEPELFCPSRKRKHVSLTDTNELFDVPLDVPQHQQSLAPNDDCLLYTVEQLNALMDINMIEADLAQKIGTLEACTTNINKHQELVRNTNSEIASIRRQVIQICIQASNTAVASRVRHTYARLLRQFWSEDRDKCLESQEDSTETKVDLNTIVEDLKIIMVSARAYRQLLKRADPTSFEGLLPDQNGNSVLESFTTEQTGIPELARHCKVQAQAKRKACYGQQLNTVAKLKNSLKMWTLSKPFNANITEDTLDAERTLLRGELDLTSQFLQEIVSQVEVTTFAAIKRNITKDLSKACEKAKADASNLTRMFSESVSTANTYKAILKRAGVFTSILRINYDLNDELAHPIFCRIGAAWRETFAETINDIVGRQMLSCHSRISRLKEYVMVRAEALGCPDHILKLVDEQLERHIKELCDAFDTFRQSVQFRQRAIRLSIQETVREGLRAGYADASAICGRGSRERMKDRMLHHVVTTRNKIFNDISKEVRKGLKTMTTRCAEELMNGVVTKVFPEIRRDCENLFRTSGPITDPDRIKLRRDIAEILQKDHVEVIDGDILVVE